MDFNDYYFYAIHNNRGESFNSEKSLYRLELILKSNYILSRRNLNNFDRKTRGWHGLDYISICDYSKRYRFPYLEGYNAYNTFIRNSLALMLKKNGIKVRKPILMPPIVTNDRSYRMMMMVGNDPVKRYSDLPDEVQVRDRISLDNLDGITLPINYMMDLSKSFAYSRDMVVSYLKDVREVLTTYDKHVNIYDLDTSINLMEGNCFRNIEKVLKKTR